MINIKFTKSPAPANAATAFQASRQDFLQTIGIQLLSLAQQAYIEKARGRTGSDGIRWKPLAASTISRKTKRGKRNDRRKATKSGKPRPLAGSTEIGVDTGLQRASASPGYVAPDGKGGNIFQLAGNQVTVGYNRTYSQYFDAVRPLIPETLPPAWQEELEETAARHDQEILDTTFNNGNMP